jgi:hypothetical protein
LSHSRRGLALPAALFTLAIIALFIAGSAFSATQEARASFGTLAERSALETAEYGAAAMLRDWDATWNVATAVGQILGPFTHTMPNGATATVRMTRTSMSTWWVTSEGTTGAAVARDARRTLNALFRLDLIPGVHGAALSVADSASVTGTGLVSGTDSVESTGLCASLTSTSTAGVAAPDTTRITGIGGIIGTPPLVTDSSVSVLVSTLDSALVADIVLPDGAIVTPSPVVTGGVCDTTAVANWGDPGGGACSRHFPVIRAMGDLIVRGGMGQGILIAAGDVQFENGAAFSGIVTPRDDFVTGNGGGSVLGVVIAGDVRRGAGDHSVVGSGSWIRRSTCRVHQARLAAAHPMRITQRWWAEFH